MPDAQGVVRFHGGHGRDGLIYCGPATCVRCDSETVCLVGDASHDEYRDVALCRPCIEWVMGYVQAGRPAERTFEEREGDYA